MDSGEKEGKYESYFVVHNIAKRHNVGTLARSATAFGVAEMILIERRDFNAFGSHGSTSHVRFRHFKSLSLVRAFLKERDCDIWGVEITDNAVAVNEHPFRKSTAFLLGNEGTGLSDKEFWAGFSERTREGSKFLVADKLFKRTKKIFCCETAESVAEERKLRKESYSNGFFDHSVQDEAPSYLLDELLGSFIVEEKETWNCNLVAHWNLCQYLAIVGRTRDTECLWRSFWYSSEESL